MLPLYFSARSVLARFKDGHWENCCPHDASEGTGTTVMEAIKIGAAIAHGWLEQDDTWIRLTKDGKQELARKP